MSAFVNEGIRYLWELNDLPIIINDDGVTVSVSQENAYQFSKISNKSNDWKPIFGNEPYPILEQNSGPVANGNSPHGWSLIPQQGFTKMQVAYDVQPEWVGSIAQNNQEVFAILEHATNLLDFQFAKALGIQYRMTGIVQRMDTNLYGAKSLAETQTFG